MASNPDVQERVEEKFHEYRAGVRLFSTVLDNLELYVKPIEAPMVFPGSAETYMNLLWSNRRVGISDYITHRAVHSLYADKALLPHQLFNSGYICIALKAMMKTENPLVKMLFQLAERDNGHHLRKLTQDSRVVEKLVTRSLSEQEYGEYLDGTQSLDR